VLNKMRILQISTIDKAGGAEAIAWQLFQGYRRYGHNSRLAVGLKRSNDHGVLTIPNDFYRNRLAKGCIAVGALVSPLVDKVRGAAKLHRLLQVIGEPQRLLDLWQGKEDFDFSATWRLLDLLPERPDIIHCHNLHGACLPSGGYFDLRALPRLSHEIPVVVTLHDAWLLSGHCSHSFDCERWKTGCGHCPDLTIYPPVRRDSTAYNWRRKKNIYAKSQLYVATPCQWLMEKMEQSMLASAVVEARVISNGVDLSVFHPADKRVVRAALGIPQGAKVLLFTANGIRRNIWKDYQRMRTAAALVGERLTGQGVLFLALGEDAPSERIGQTEVYFVPYQQDPEVVARYYQAADVYLHAARADTFPNTVLEALACGTPVVATAVGGIPEQVRSLNHSAAVRHEPLHEPDKATGVLVSPGDAGGMAESVVTLLSRDHLCYQIAENAAKDAQQRFDLSRQCDAYLAWYDNILTRWQTTQSFATRPVGEAV
jgi:glycosyltransferase involved in cell wall biosynthesis